MSDTAENVEDVEMPLSGGSETPFSDNHDVPAGPPEGVPEKFWDKETHQVRIDALAKSYQELERKLGGVEAVTIPETPDDYEVVLNGDFLETDPDVNHRLHAAGLTNDQVQAVYELAEEKLVPIVNSLAGEQAMTLQTDRLKDHFGGEEKWNEARRQISTWGRENFPEDVFSTLSSTYEGVLTMQKMMANREPGLGRTDRMSGTPNESTLKAMMSEPRYWRDRDPAYVEQVRQGFRNLYPDD